MGNTIVKGFNRNDPEFLHNIPQPLYKYRVWFEPFSKVQNSRRILTDTEVYLASPDQFNDPFDCSLPFKYKKEDLTPANVFLKLSSMLRKDFPNLKEEEVHKLCFERQKSGVFESGEYWKSLHPSHVQEMNDTFGILSLTSSRDSLLMWSHYANSYKGFCVGLDKFILYENCPGVLGKVFYNSKFPEIGLFDESPMALTTLTMTKSECWQYEDEYRISCIYAPRKIVPLPNDVIIEIILGCKMEEGHKVEIIELAKEKFPRAKIFETQINWEEFKLDFIPIINVHN